MLMKYNKLQIGTKETFLHDFLKISIFLESHEKSFLITHKQMPSRTFNQNYPSSNVARIWDFLYRNIAL